MGIKIGDKNPMNQLFANDQVIITQEILKARDWRGIENIRLMRTENQLRENRTYDNRDRRRVSMDGN